jgi:hypothetical protein
VREEEGKKDLPIPVRSLSSSQVNFLLLLPSPPSSCPSSSLKTMRTSAWKRLTLNSLFEPRMTSSEGIYIEYPGPNDAAGGKKKGHLLCTQRELCLEREREELVSPIEEASLMSGGVEAFESI